MHFDENVEQLNEDKTEKSYFTIKKHLNQNAIDLFGKGNENTVLIDALKSQEIF